MGLPHGTEPEAICGSRGGQGQFQDIDRVACKKVSYRRSAVQVDRHHAASVIRVVRVRVIYGLGYVKERSLYIFDEHNVPVPV